MFLKKTSLNWALKHVMKEGDTDLFPLPFEFDVIKAKWAKVLPELEKTEIHTHTWGGPRRLMVPKSDFSFRAVCQLDPLDAILFAAIMKEIGRNIEKRRSPPSDETVFSYRFDPAPDGRLYAKTTGWEQYWRVSAARCSQFKYVLVTDLSDYYNQIYHHTIENQLDLCKVKKQYWQTLKNLISNTTEGVSRGIPIGPHPSHLLAEMATIPIDNFLQSLGVTYCRYVDDMNIFCNSRDECHEILYKLVDYLDKNHKIQVNKQKTGIHKSDAYVKVCNDNTIDKPINKLERELLAAVRSYTNSPYERVRITRVSANDLAKLSQSNIESILNEYITATDIDYIRLRWFLRRLAQVGAPGGIAFIVKNFDDFIPAISEIGQYFESAAQNFTGDWKDIGEDLVKIYDRGIVQASEYLQVVILSLFSRINGINHINHLTKMYPKSTPMCQRKIMLAAAASNSSSWLSSLKSSYKNADTWNRRSIIYSLRVLPKDERQFWAKAAKRRLNGLDALILDSIF